MNMIDRMNWDVQERAIHYDIIVPTERLVELITKSTNTF